jgi:hypothetical protein
VLAHWGARSLGAPASTGDLSEGWLADALCIALPPTDARLEFRIGDEIAGVDRGEIVEGPLAEPDAVVVGAPADFYALLVNHDLDAVSIEGNSDTVAAIVAALPPARTEAALAD